MFGVQSRTFRGLGFRGLGFRFVFRLVLGSWAELDFQGTYSKSSKQG